MRRYITALKIHIKAFSVVVIIYPKAGEIYYFLINKKEGKLCVWRRSKLMEEQRSGNYINIESPRTMTAIELKKMIVTISQLHYEKHDVFKFSFQNNQELEQKDKYLYFCSTVFTERID